MFVRGGVYKVVHEAMGGTLAKFSVSALMFDYVLTGPISAVSAGLYLGGLINETGDAFPYCRAAREHAVFRGRFRRGGDALLLAQEHHRDSRIEREGAAHHADHHRHGGDADRLVPGHHLPPRLQPGSAAGSLQPALQPGRAGVAQRHGGAVHHRDCHPGRVGPLAARHERRREPGAGEPRNRPSQAEEPGARRLRDLHLQHAVHVAGFVLRGDDHSRRGAGQLPRQPDRRPCPCTWWDRSRCACCSMGSSFW